MTRLEKLRGEMNARGLDAVFVTDEINERYFLRYPFTDGLLLITGRRAFMVTDFRYEEEAKKNADPAFEVVCPKVRAAFITDTLTEDGCKTVGYEDETLTVAQLRSFEETYRGFSFAPVGSLFRDMRRVKDEDEIALIAGAQEITDKAFSHLLSVMRPDMTEIEVALELDFTMRRLGAEGCAFETIAVSGDASAMPHGHPRNEKLKKGFLTMDFGALLGGYCSDMTRTVVIGRADEEMRRVYGTVLEAQSAALAYLRDGVTGAAADKVARDIINRAGYEGCFGHSLGHGVGMFIHESPRLSASSKDTLVPGNIVTVEPGIYLSGKYGCRIEDMVAIVPGGIRDFTASRKELIELF